MTAKQTALFPGNEDKVGYWLTPPDLMAKLQAEFDFDFDACPYPRPAGFDGLKEPWGKRTWVNPPFYGSSPVSWTRKAIMENGLGKTVVLILPAIRLQHVVEPMLTAHAEYRLLGLVAWRDPDGNTIPRPTAQILFILRPKP
jgi:hypothetical protein